MLRAGRPGGASCCSPALSWRRGASILPSSSTTWCVVRSSCWAPVCLYQQSCSFGCICSLRELFIVILYLLTPVVSASCRRLADAAVYLVKSAAGARSLEQQIIARRCAL